MEILSRVHCEEKNTRKEMRNPRLLTQNPHLHLLDKCVKTNSSKVGILYDVNKNRMEGLANLIKSYFIPNKTEKRYQMLNMKKILAHFDVTLQQRAGKVKERNILQLIRLDRHFSEVKMGRDAK